MDRRIKPYRRLQIKTPGPKFQCCTKFYLASPAFRALKCVQLPFFHGLVLPLALAVCFLLPCLGLPYPSFSLAPCYLLFPLGFSPLASCSASRPFLSFSRLLLLVLALAAASCFLFLLPASCSCSRSFFFYLFAHLLLLLLLFLCLLLASVSPLAACSFFSDALPRPQAEVGGLSVKEPFRPCWVTPCQKLPPRNVALCNVRSVFMTSSRRSYHDSSYLAATWPHSPRPTTLPYKLSINR